MLLLLAAYGVAIIPVVTTPAARTYVPVAEDRTTTPSAEDRTYTPAEER